MCAADTPIYGYTPCQRGFCRGHAAGRAAAQSGGLISPAVNKTKRNTNPSGFTVTLSVHMSLSSPVPLSTKSCFAWLFQKAPQNVTDSAVNKDERKAWKCYLWRAVKLCIKNVSGKRSVALR